MRDTNGGPPTLRLPGTGLDQPTKPGHAAAGEPPPTRLIIQRRRPPLRPGRHTPPLSATDARRPPGPGPAPACAPGLALRRAPPPAPPPFVDPPDLRVRHAAVGAGSLRTLPWPGSGLRQLPLLLLLAVVTFLFLRHAWVTEDAYITFRTIDNLVHGHGLRWNVTERVQPFTHPLWLLLLTPLYALEPDVMFAALTLSFASVVAMWLLLERSFDGDRWLFAGLVAAPLLLSPFFQDFCSSGLENPLTFALAAGLWWTVARADQWPLLRRATMVGLLAGLAATNRQDTVLFFAPALLHLLVTAPRGLRGRVARRLGLGLLPWLAWSAFALLYYGFVFPNTYYAKITTGIGSARYLAQGVVYFFDLVGRDPLVALWLLAALVLVGLRLGLLVGLLRRRIAPSERQGATAAYGLGLALYVGYVVAVGGDFMAVRFWTLPYLAAVVLVADTLAGALTAAQQAPAEGGGAASRVQPPRWAVLAGVAAVAWLGSSLALPQGSGRRFERSGVANERAYSERSLTLLATNRDSGPWTHPASVRGERLRRQARHQRQPLTHVSGNVGMLGYHAGPRVVLVDRNALSEPLLARLPVTNPERWRIGHFRRELPAGYLHAVQTGDTSQLDRDLAVYYAALRTLVSAPVFDPQRLRTLARWYRGDYDGHRASYLARARRDATTRSTGPLAQRATAAGAKGELPPGPSPPPGCRLR